MTTKIQVDAFTCDCCKGQHWRESDADKCCTCQICDVKAVKPAKSRQWNYTCAKCRRKIALRASKDAIRRVEASIVVAKERVDHLERELMARCAEHEVLKSQILGPEPAVPS
jgi:hypothetical protein